MHRHALYTIKFCQNDRCVFLERCVKASLCRRALLGITLKKEFHIINIPELANNKIACVCPVSMDVREREYSPVQVWNLKYEQVRTIQLFLCVIINTNPVVGTSTSPKMIYEGYFKSS